MGERVEDQLPLVAAVLFIVVLTFGPIVVGEQSLASPEHKLFYGTTLLIQGWNKTYGGPAWDLLILWCRRVMVDTH